MEIPVQYQEGSFFIVEPINPLELAEILKQGQYNGRPLTGLKLGSIIYDFLLRDEGYSPIRYGKASRAFHHRHIEPPAWYVVRAICKKLNVID